MEDKHSYFRRILNEHMELNQMHSIAEIEDIVVRFRDRDQYDEKNILRGLRTFLHRQRGIRPVSREENMGLWIRLRVLTA